MSEIGSQIRTATETFVTPDEHAQQPGPVAEPGLDLVADLVRARRSAAIDQAQPR